MSATNYYDNPLITRYASREMAELWGPQRKFSIWRRLWLALAEAQMELGMKGSDGAPRINLGQIAELRDHLDDIDFAKAAHYERRLRHDVMAHVHTLAEAAPGCRDIIHLGATSCYVTDNADLILIREGMERIRGQLVGAIDHLARFAELHKDLACLGYTHFQPAQLTTVGKRACLWCYDFALDFHEIESRIRALPFRGVKGTTGTQASFLTLFGGDHEQVKQLDQLVAKKMGFAKSVSVAGQTYSRKIDSQVLAMISGIAQSAAKFGNDLRLLAHEQELDEPFESEQIGSSAMAYKRNPMRSERICSLARFVMGLLPIAEQTAANQWLERTLDDSAARRLYLPQAFLGVDSILRLVINIVSGMKANPHIIARHVTESLPYMATETILMAAVAKGGDRQQLHERIRQASHEVTAKHKAGEPADLIAILRSDNAFAGLDWEAINDPAQYVGRAPQQTDEFIQGVVDPIRRQYPSLLHQAAQVNV